MKFRKYMLCQFGKKKCSLTVPMHGTNQYDFKLITLLVTNDRHKGIPVAWVISNREDILAMTEILKTIKD